MGVKLGLKTGCGVKCGRDSSGSGQGPVVGWFEHSNEPSGSIKCRKFAEYLNDKKESAPWSWLVIIC
jgi:hypothetical protein